MTQIVTDFPAINYPHLCRTHHWQAFTPMEPRMTTSTDELAQLTREFELAQQRLAEARRRATGGGSVAPYTFHLAPSGAPVTLAQLFGGKRDLLVVHNMGAKCSYCTMWADGYAGLYKHIADRAAFVLATPDEPAAAGAFASARHWPFPVVSTANQTDTSGAGRFHLDMGFGRADGGVIPGISAFHKRDDGTIIRSCRSQQFGPGDPFCPAWPMFDLLEGGAGAWQPKFHY
jgi:predicted dithiol-disulfide oxidoreductase (DUF899 family)